MGVEKTVLVFSDNKHAIYGRDVHRVTMTDMHMTRKHSTLRLGLTSCRTTGTAASSGSPQVKLRCNRRSLIGSA